MYFDENWNEIEESYSGMKARIIQDEISLKYHIIVLLRFTRGKSIGCSDTFIISTLQKIID